MKPIFLTSLIRLSFGLCLSFGLVSTVNATLMGRLPLTPMGTDYQAYYDDVLNITWLVDANAAAGTIFDDGSSAIDGFITWTNATTWAASLTVEGIAGWRLPNMDINNDGSVIDCTGGGVSGCSDNEYGHLYHETGITTAVPAPFSNLGNKVYWSSTELGFGNAAFFAFFNGNSAGSGKANNFLAIAVHDGDVSAIPVPAAIWLMGSALLGLVGIRRKSISYY